jgi:hypothetical protein
MSDLVNFAEGRTIPGEDVDALPGESPHAVAQAAE